MNESMQPAGLLRAAATLIDRALGELDRARVACKECGIAHLVNYDQGRVYEQLESAPEKLRQCANRLVNESNHAAIAAKKEQS